MTNTTFTVLRDQVFRPSCWTESILRCPTPLGLPDHGATILCDQIHFGGSEGAFRQVIHTWGKPPYNRENSTVFVKHLQNTSVFKPSIKGAITTIDFSCNLMVVDATSETIYALLLEQNGQLYVSNRTFIVRSTDWFTFSMVDMTSKDFRKVECLVEDPRRPCSSDDHPNFSLLGKDIYFGYVTLSSTSLTRNEAISGIDNWKVTIAHESIEFASQQRKIMQMEHNLGVLQHDLNTSIGDLKKAKANLIAKEEMLDYEKTSFSQRVQRAIEHERQNIEQEVKDIVEKLEYQHEQNLSQSKEELQEVTQALDDMTKERADLTMMLADSESRIAELTQSCAQVDRERENELQSMREKVAEFAKLMAVTQEDSSRERDSLLKIEENNKWLCRELKDSRLVCEQLEHSHRVLLDELRDSRLACNDLNGRVISLERILGVAQSERAGFIDSLDTAKRDVDRLQEQVAVLQKPTTNCGNLETSIDAVEKEFSEVVLEQKLTWRIQPDKALTDSVDNTEEDDDWEVVAAPQS